MVIKNLGIYAKKGHKRGQYLRDRNNFFILCRKCHINYDWKESKVKINKEGKFIQLEGGDKNGRK